MWDFVYFSLLRKKIGSDVEIFFRIYRSFFTPRFISKLVNFWFYVWVTQKNFVHKQCWQLIVQPIKTPFCFIHIYVHITKKKFQSIFFSYEERKTAISGCELDYVDGNKIISCTCFMTQKTKLNFNKRVWFSKGFSRIIRWNTIVFWLNLGCNCLSIDFFWFSQTFSCFQLSF